MIKKMTILIFIIIISIIQIQTVFGEGNNLLRNPGFEESGLEHYFWEQRVWEKSPGAYEIKVMKDDARWGKNYIRIKSNVLNDARLVQLTDVKPSTLYKISGWLRTQNIGTDAKGANLSVWLLGETSKELKGDNIWTYLEWYGRTGPGQTKLEFTVGIGGHGSLNQGTADFDEIKIEEAKSIPQGASIVNLYHVENGGSTSNSTLGGKGAIFLFITLLIILIGIPLFIIFKKNTGSNQGAYGEEVKGNGSDIKEEDVSMGKTWKYKLDRKDFIIMTVMTVIYLAVALLNLGSTHVPETFWKPSQLGESFIVDFDREYDIARISYYDGIGDIKLRIDNLEKDGVYRPIGTMDQDVYKALRWQGFDTAVKARSLKITVDKVGGTLNEIVFFERGGTRPITGFRVRENEIGKNDLGKIQNLFDEQDVGSYDYNFMNSSYFDEVYHPRTAFENLNRMEPLETSHPPLGKLLIALGVSIFGMNPFGWRIMGTLFGAAMIPAMYLLGRRLFSGRIYAFGSAFLIMFDFMHFAQTRIGTIDSYPTFFVILAYFFMAGSFLNKSYKMSFKKSLIPLFAAGLCWGLGMASKWTALSTGGGLAVLYFTSKVIEYLDFKKVLRKRKRKEILPVWTGSFVRKNIIYTSLCCVIFFVIIPVLIYVSSYLPIITLPGPQHNLEEVVRYQKNMSDYHVNLTVRHPFESPAYSWPLISKPLLEYRGEGLPQNKVSIIYVLGNPAIFWFGIVCVFVVIAIGIWKRDKRALLIIVAFAFQYLPWFTVTRCIFIYHFFTAVPFLILSVIYVLEFLQKDLPGVMAKAFMDQKIQFVTYKAANGFIIGYLAVVGILFAVFYPAISGLVVDSSYLEWVKWLGIG
ncbi:MAG: glycosyltransferase family 39 protein [Clostridia bacterium]|nr:glycosyltransferase family 39 protein [Clostridia bacterium]